MNIFFRLRATWGGGLIHALFIVWLSVYGLSTLAGPGDLGGGNADEIEFKDLGEQWIEAFQESKINGDDLGLSIPTFINAVRTVKVISEDRSFPMDLDGRAQCAGGRSLPNRHAVNSLSQRTIHVNGRLWGTWKDAVKRRLVLHEYLRFARDSSQRPVSDCGNVVSLRILSSLRELGWSEGDRRSPEEIAAEAKVAENVQDPRLRRYTARFDVASSRCLLGQFLMAAARMMLPKDDVCEREMAQAGRLIQRRSFELANKVELQAEDRLEVVCTIAASQWSLLRGTTPVLHQVRGESTIEAAWAVARECMRDGVCNALLQKNLPHLMTCAESKLIREN